MWGYIDVEFSRTSSINVPSLYVRVYRLLQSGLCKRSCSLIICEGISARKHTRRNAPRFPHYMWGYIMSKTQDSFFEQVPSLYVRVYHYATAPALLFLCSLIICEGISALKVPEDMPMWFPHYMWGYIAAGRIGDTERKVPSLYVRVYRKLSNLPEPPPRSLIICEGISAIRYTPARVLSFPHYMWGYIRSIRRFYRYDYVPSLYVRVYRKWGLAVTFLACSLIICEGISNLNLQGLLAILFPHYMWGYILYPPAGGFKFWLPSLYVRVYRSGSFAYEGKWSSLIICEGISPDILDLRYKWLFPHYMWGYIGTGGVIVKKSDVPSLYVRVYHSRQNGARTDNRSLIICEGISQRQGRNDA